MLATALRTHLCTLVYMAVDGTIEHANSQEDEKEDDEREKDVCFGIERKEGGAFVQAANTVPAQQGKEANHQRQTPAECNQAEDAIVALCGRLLGQWLHHRGVTLHSNQQQAEDGCCQGHKDHPFSKEPQRRGEAKCLVAGQADVDHIGSAGEEVTECDVGNADINPAPAMADARDDSSQHQNILQDDEKAEEEEAGRGGTDVVLGT